MVKYFVRVRNSKTNGFSIDCETEHDAEIAVETIRKANAYLPDSLRFIGWVTVWKGYRLDDGSYVTESAEPVVDLDFL